MRKIGLSKEKWAWVTKKWMKLGKEYDLSGIGYTNGCQSIAFTNKDFQFTVGNYEGRKNARGGIHHGGSFRLHSYRLSYPIGNGPITLARFGPITVIPSMGVEFRAWPISGEAALALAMRDKHKQANIVAKEHKADFVAMVDKFLSLL
jgi:hypothetical protein